MPRDTSNLSDAIVSSILDDSSLSKSQKIQKLSDGNFDFIRDREPTSTDSNGSSYNKYGVLLNNDGDPIGFEDKISQARKYGLSTFSNKEFYDSSVPGGDFSSSNTPYAKFQKSLFGTPENAAEN